MSSALLPSAACSGGQGTDPPASLASVTPSRPPAAPTPAAADEPQAVLYRVRRSARIDLGWTGIAHGQPWPEQQLRFDLVCPAGSTTCGAAGGAKGAPFGGPVPLSAGGVPVCVINRFREPLTGTVDAASGCGEISLRLASTVFLAADVASPCPLCRGDAVALDGRDEGRCDGGANAGAACDADGTSPLFGSTSNDCPPRGQSVGELDTDLLPMTTGALRVEVRVGCAKKLPTLAERCFCPGQSRPNECDSGSCAEGELCDTGPTDGACSDAPYRSCRPGSGRADCGDLFPGAGACENRSRRCFGDSIAAAGACSPTAPTYVAVFCVAATRAPALNNTAGLPGPARLVLPLARAGSDPP